MTKSCFWIIVENRNPDEFRDNLETLYETNDNISYVCGQLEEGTHRHFQCYMQLKRAQAASWLKNNVSKTAHLEIQYKKATAEDGRHYASKPHEECVCVECDKERAAPTKVPDTFVEYGQIRKKGKGEGQGARTDLNNLRDAIRDNRTQKSIIEDDELNYTLANNLRYHDRVRSLYKPPPRVEGVTVHLYVGLPGTGKTRRAYEEYPDLFEIPVSNGTMWLDGYDDQEVVLFDDFMGRGSKMGLDNTLKFLDRYVRSVPVKGAYVWYRPRLIIITSNYHPRHWYDWKNREDSWLALKRRIHRIWYYPTLDSGPEEQNLDYYLEDKNYWPEEFSEPRYNQ